MKFAKAHTGRAVFIRQSAYNLSFPDGVFDVICAIQVVEHLKNPDAFFSQAYRVLKHNGLLLLATSNPSGVSARILKDKWRGYREDHISLKKPQEWKRLLQNSRFHVLEDGTTGLTGFKIFQNLPFGLINWIPMALFGYSPWYKGDSYMMVARLLKDHYEKNCFYSEC